MDEINNRITTTGTGLWLADTIPSYFLRSKKSFAPKWSKTRHFKELLVFMKFDTRIIGSMKLTFKFDKNEIL